MLVAREKPLTIGRVMRQVPFLAGLVLLYLLVVVIDANSLPSVLFDIGLPSEARWLLTIGDLILMIGLILLFAEIVKATRTSRITIADHALSLVTFIICLMLFLLMPRCGTSVFFMIMWMTVIDVIAGFTVSLTGARRDIDLGAQQ